MGEHLKEKLRAVEQWLRSRYGDSDRRALDHIYSEEYQRRWKPRKPFEADYIKEIDGKMVYADVVGPNDEWRGVVGKIVCYAANAERIGKNYEVWLVTDLDDDPKTASLTGEEKARHVQGWEMYFRELRGILDLTLKPTVAQRVKMFNKCAENQELSPL